MDAAAKTTPQPWTKERIQKLIDDKIEEGSYLQYKAAAGRRRASLACFICYQFSCFRRIRKRGLESNGKARKRFRDN